MPAPLTGEIIDAHHHLWRYHPEDYAWIGPEMKILQRDFLPGDLQQEIATVNLDTGIRIAGSVVVQARQTVEETEWLLDLADTTPWIHGVVGWLPLRSPELPALLQTFVSREKLRGVRHVVQDEPDPDFLLHEDFNRGIDALLDTGLVYDLLIHEHQLPQADRFVRLHPRQSFVLDHLAKPLVRDSSLQPWYDNLQRLAENPNVSCKLSGLVTEADWSNWSLQDLEPYLNAALELFGPDRLMAGSDWPVCLLASGYRQWWSLLKEWAATLPPLDRDKLMAGTARRLYHLT